MNDRLQNQLNMVGACITVAQSSDYKPVWNGKDPADFSTDLAALQADYGAVTAEAAQAAAATGGATDAKAAGETALEDDAFVLARALASHFRKTGDLDRLGKVDLTKTQIVKLRSQNLVNETTATRDLATVAVAETDAAKRGVTAAREARTVLDSPRQPHASRETPYSLFPAPCAFLPAPAPRSCAPVGKRSTACPLQSINPQRSTITPDFCFLLSAFCFPPRVHSWFLLAALALPALGQPSGYYAPAEGLAGAELRAALHQLIRAHNVLPYTSTTRTDTRAALKHLDRDSDDTNRVLLIYAPGVTDLIANFGLTTGWNREHLWPDSYGLDGTGPAYTDLRQLPRRRATRDHQHRQGRSAPVPGGHLPLRVRLEN